MPSQVFCGLLCFCYRHIHSSWLHVSPLPLPLWQHTSLQRNDLRFIIPEESISVLEISTNKRQPVKIKLVQFCCVMFAAVFNVWNSSCIHTCKNHTTVTLQYCSSLAAAVAQWYLGDGWLEKAIQPTLL